MSSSNDSSSPRNSSPDNATPDNATPDNATPDNATPDNETPDNATPDNAPPGKSTPDKSTPANSTSDKSASDKLTPTSSPSANSTQDKSTPASSSPDNSTPDKSTPQNSTSDKSTSDKSTPNNSAPDKSTSDKSSANASAPDKSTSGKSTPVSPTSDNSAPEKSTPDKSTPDKSTPEKSTPEKSKPDDSTSDKPAADISSPAKSTPDQSASDDKSKPDNSAPDKSTPDNSTPDIPAPPNSEGDKSTPNNSTPANSTPVESTPSNVTPNSPTPPDVSTIENTTPEKSAPVTSTSEKPIPDKSASVNSKQVNSALDHSNNASTPPGSSSSSSSLVSPNKSLPAGKEVPSGDNNNNNNKALVGGAIGGAFVLLIMIIICVVWSRKKNKKQKHYYGGPPPAGIANNNGFNSGQQPHPNWSGPQGGQDHAIRMQQQGHDMGMGMGMGTGPPSGGWGQSPYPPMNSAEMNNNYSRGMTTPPSVLPSPSLGLAHSASGGTFVYEELAAATNNFSNDNIIGQGGFGYVHKGVLPNGKEVAVKSLKSGSGQGEREFQAEIDIISRVHHRHLVSLVGYCISGGQRMLVYEFVPNKTLEHHLHGKGVPTMDWASRMRIARGSAKGLAYLHEDCNPRIIHRDIKAANVLLDDSFEAKVADFGLAKLTTDNNTHVSTRVMGTFGYLAPEYASSGKLTDKSDVFSFGVMLLELITGKRPIDLTNAIDDSLVDWARPRLSGVLEDNPNFGELVDPFLEGNYDSQEMARMVACAAASIRHSAKKRAKMSQIVRVLEGDVSLEDLKDGPKNMGSGQSKYTSSSGSSEYDTMQYNADILKFRKAIMSSQEFDSSELSSKEFGK